MVSVIVPVAPTEQLLDDFLRELETLPPEFEVLLVSTEVTNRQQSQRWTWLQAPQSGRATALNTGAKQAQHEWLWFVHADSRNLATLVPPLLQAQQQHPNALLFFDLHYYDGSLPHKISAWGAHWRSKFFAAPFGDQAFCIRKSNHELIGGYRTDVAYGEDHLYARAVKAAGIKHQLLPAKVGTSARMHLQHGWLKIVCKYQYMWIKQALAN